MQPQVAQNGPLLAGVATPTTAKVAVTSTVRIAAQKPTRIPGDGVSVGGRGVHRHRSHSGATARCSATPTAQPLARSSSPSTSGPVETGHEEALGRHDEPAPNGL